MQVIDTVGREPEIPRSAAPREPLAAAARGLRPVAPFPTITDELLARLDVPGPRYTSYPTVPVWRDDFSSDEHAAALERAAARPEAPLSLYVHIPFCQELCTYCGCNVIVSRDSRRAERYLETLPVEIALAARHLGARRRVSRLHLGGGTPTFLDERQLSLLWRAVTAHFDVLPDAEVALEIDPVVTRPTQLELLRSFGFNRLSMGVQDFDPDVQQAVHRIQTVEETGAMVDLARRLGFKSVNFDLIYGLPRQTPASWRRTLDQVVSLRPDRMAVFSFAYVPEARPNQRRLPVADIPTGRSKLELFRIAYDAFTAAGYRPIGMDHFALPDDELARAEERRALWRDFQGYTVDHYETVAFGTSGISDIGGAYMQNHRSLMDWESAILAGRFATSKGIALTDDDLRRRDVITRLMSNFWIDLGDDAPRFAAELAALRPLGQQGLVEIDGSVVALTPVGRLFVRNVAMTFDAHLRAEKLAARPVFSRTV